MHYLIVANLTPRRPHNLCGPTSSNSSMLHIKKELNHHITAKCFSNPQTFWGPTLKTLGVRLATN